MEINIALADRTDLGSEHRARPRLIETEVTARGHLADWAVHDVPVTPHYHVMIPLCARSPKGGIASKHISPGNPDGNIIYRPDGKPQYEQMAGR